MHRAGAVALLLCLPIMAWGSQAYAQVLLPQGGKVVSGQARIDAAGNGLTITQSSSRSVIDWNGFSIGESGAVNFVQPNAGSATLNRVTGQTSSVIAGKISANGQVFLVNPNGIAITSTGTVQVGGGFVASTLDIDTADFNAGRLVFAGKGASAAVSNAGVISAAPGSFVGLIGGTVSNSGTINVPLGQVGLGSGEMATLNPTGDGFLQVAIPTSATAANGRALIDVTGRIKSAGGRVQIKAATAQRLVRDVINVSGAVTARSVRGRSGSIILDGGDGGAVTVSGRLSANGDRVSKGGTIVATGSKIALTSTARVSADGANGGSVLIGGDMRGGVDAAAKLVSETVRTAATTSIAQGAIVSANGRTGAGGNVVIWSDTVTDFRGSILATGAGSAAGGAVEVSSHGVLGYNGRVDVTAASGSTGTLLLDPYNVTISTGANSNISGSTPFTPSGNSSVLNVTTLQNALATANVTVNTGSSGAQSGDITVANAVTWSSGNSLTLTSARDILVNANITTNGGALNLNAGRGVTVTGATINTSGGGLIVTGSTTDGTTGITLNGATISVGTGTATLTGTATTGKGVFFTTNANTLTASGAGSITIVGNSSTTVTNYGVALNTSLTTSGSVSISGANTGSASQAYGLYVNGGNTITDSSGNLSLSGTSTSANGVWFNSATTTLTNSGAGTLALNGISGSLNGIRLNTSVGLATSGTVTLSGTSTSGSGFSAKGSNTLTVSSGNLTISGATSSGSLGIDLSSSGNAITNSGSGTLTLSGTGGTNLAATITSSSGVLAIGDTSAVTQSGGTITAGSLLLSGGGSFSLGQANLVGTLAATGVGSMSFVNNQSLTIGTVQTTSGISALASASVTITTSGTSDITVNNAVTGSSGNAVSLTAGRDILVNAGMTTNGGALALNAGRAVSISNATIATSGGNLIASGTTTDSTTAITLNGATISVGGGTASLSGTGSTSGLGVRFTSAASALSASGSGSITITGQSGSTNGVQLDAGLTTSGTVSLSGTSSAATGVQFGAVTFNVASGNATVNGTSSATTGSGSTIGTRLAGTAVSNSGSGALTIQGTSNDAGTANSGSAGVLWSGTSSLANSGGGSLSISGTNTSGYGTEVKTSATLTTSGPMSISGASTSGYGLFLASGTTVTASSGNLSLSGSSSSTIALRLRGSSITNNGAGTLALIASGDTDLHESISSTSGVLSLSQSGTFTQASGTIAATNLLLSGANGTFNLTASGNSIGTVAATAGSVALTDSSSLTIGTIAGISGLTATGTATILTSGGLTIASGASVSAASPVLSAAGAFVNNAGSSAVTATSGRWLIYSSAPGSDSFGGLDSANTAIWNATYATLPPASVTASGNRYLFAYQPTLTFTSTNATKTYGADVTSAIASSYSVSGYQSGVSGAFAGDSASSAFTGSPVVTSSGSGASATVGGGPYAITVAQGSLSAASGYALAFSSTGTLTVNAAPVTVTALGGSSTYGASLSNPGLSATGLQNGESASVLTGLSNSFGITNTTNAGTYTLSVVGTLTNANYTVAGTNNGSWSVNPAPVTVTAFGGSSTYGSSPGNPGLAATGLQNGETASVLTGLSNSFGITNATNAGSCTLGVTGTLTNGNYTVAGTSTGSWTVNPAPVIVTALSGFSLYGLSPTNPGLSATGLQNGQSASVLTGLSSSFGISNTSAAGSYTVSVTGTLTNPNYVVAGTVGGTWLVYSVPPAASLPAEPTLSSFDVGHFDRRIGSGSNCGRRSSRQCLDGWLDAAQRAEGLRRSVR
ncbi:filamentous hemagglutinin N-terminal domain-containing protein [Bradyrhizobium sp. CCGUVB1N3]|uniref:beta strand repeat-containing protein n=1 Tax=Bradyrhizobium sp. CCGUVB1N3 TaxID=2949629 RepID=UPI0020B40DDB|nr:filamentous hemagglutinin N-terminal domain-containing protein [Bradyrhizobium sp. CCGUVB1N3]MCP3469111.1 filamentous hemagglutinin N-terminal domain-containing protein [Bradyrhizobium sp. CCGUVB1N3]